LRADCYTRLFAGQRTPVATEADEIREAEGRPSRAAPPLLAAVEL
jgi:hypothetical protein